MYALAGAFSVLKLKMTTVIIAMFRALLVDANERVQTFIKTDNKYSSQARLSYKKRVVFA